MRRGHRLEPVEVLDAEAWETPDSLTEGDWRMEAGCDGRRACEPYDEEDER